MSQIPPNIPYSHRTAVPPVLVAQLLMAASFALFAAIAVAVLAGETQGLDDKVLIALRDAGDVLRPVGPRWFEEIMRAFTALGTGMSLTAVVLLGIAWFHFRGDRLSMGMLALVGAGGFLINTALKLLFDRPRPSVLPMLSDSDPWSFPSGHAMMTLAIFLALAVLIGDSVRGKWMRSTLVTAAVTISAFVGFSRMYLGVHYPSDVLAGWLAGTAWLSACWLIARRMKERRLARTQ